VCHGTMNFNVSCFLLLLSFKPHLWNRLVTSENFLHPYNDAFGS